MTEHASIVAPTDSAELDVSIILPVYNEVEHLKQEVDRIRAAMDASPYSYEIIVVDDGSSDNSAEVASRIPGIRFLHFLQNRLPDGSLCTLYEEPGDPLRRADSLPGLARCRRARDDGRDNNASAGAAYSRAAGQLRLNSDPRAPDNTVGEKILGDPAGAIDRDREADPN